MKVLIIDDDETIVLVWSNTLKKEGFEVITASEGKSGLEMAKTQKPDFVLMDQIMPDIKGNDLLKNFKSGEETKNIPVALITNYSDNHLMQEAINQGAIDYILKYQIEPEELAGKIKGLIQESKSGSSA